MRRSASGVTLIELMVSLFVLAIVTAIAIPSFRDLMRRHAITSGGNTLAGSLAYARSEAAMRGSFVSLCPSDDGARCVQRTAYAPGWIVYAYPVGADGPDQAYDAGKDGFVLLRRIEAMDRVAITAADTAVITFGQLGQLRREVRTDGAPPLRFVICTRGDAGAENPPGAPGARLEVGVGGGVRQAPLAAGAGCAPG
jgi:type IV fimbrial biogenesis protein FimT